MKDYTNENDYDTMLHKAQTLAKSEQIEQEKWQLYRSVNNTTRALQYSYMNCSSSGIIELITKKTEQLKALLPKIERGKKALKKEDVLKCVDLAHDVSFFFEKIVGDLKEENSYEH